MILSRELGRFLIRIDRNYLLKIYDSREELKFKIANHTFRVSVLFIESVTRFLIFTFNKYLGGI